MPSALWPQLVGWDATLAVLTIFSSHSLYIARLQRYVRSIDNVLHNGQEATCLSLAFSEIDGETNSSYDIQQKAHPVYHNILQT